jgi:CheY-like chemotaxis protein
MAKSPRSRPQDVSSSITARVLIADDISYVRLLLAATLESRGHTVLEATNGDQALEMLIEHRPDVAILDVVMPGLDGLEVCRAVRAHPTLQSLPVILLSANANDEDARQAGADRFIAKPFLPSALLNQSHSGIYMVGLLQDGIDEGCKGVSLSLEHTSASTLDLVGPLGDVAEELADVLLDLGLGPETGVGGHLFSDPAQMAASGLKSGL